MTGLVDNDVYCLGEQWVTKERAVNVELLASTCMGLHSGDPLATATM